MTERLLTPEEVAQWLATTERKIMEMARASELPGLKIGKEWRFDRGEIQSYLDQRRSSPRPAESSEA
jgi:excisionase family DNA binding protein